MPYIPHTKDDINRMLSTIGVNTVDDLFKSIPEGLRLSKPLNLPPGLDEPGLWRALSGLSDKNRSVDKSVSFLGAGVYNHYIPSLVRRVVARSEFYTAYTPYQPEVSQGTLQAIFEYQTLICQLTGMQASNASMYDGASATAEAALMSGRINRRSDILISKAVHPEYRETVKTYLLNQEKRVIEADYCSKSGQTLLKGVEKAICDNTSALIVQYPNFFGSVEEIGAFAKLIHSRGGLLIVVVAEPVALGLLQSPGFLGADIVVGEGQSLGNDMALGGPLLGFFATRMEYIRQIPGRIVGQSVDSRGRRAYCLTLATREQHIRRERATSNICSNEGLCAVAAAVFMASYGKKGFAGLSKLNFFKAQYLKMLIGEMNRCKISFSGPTFNEFVIEVSRDPQLILSSLLEKGIIGGLPLARFYPELSRHILLSVTEMNSREDLERLASELSRLV